MELCPFGKQVPKDVQQKALAAAEAIKQGKKVIFQGPLKDRDGKERLAKGANATSKQLAEMDWFVEGVGGTLPKHK